MHEYAVTSELVELAVSECERHGVDAPTKLICELGALSTYKPEPIEFYFSIFKEEHPMLGGTELEIREIPALILCRQCNREHNLSDITFIRCPECSGIDVEIVSGRDFRLHEIVWEDEHVGEESTGQ